MYSFLVVGCSVFRLAGPGNIGGQLGSQQDDHKHQQRPNDKETLIVYQNSEIGTGLTGDPQGGGTHSASPCHDLSAMIRPDPTLWDLYQTANSGRVCWTSPTC